MRKFTYLQIYIRTIVQKTFTPGCTSWLVLRVELLLRTKTNNCWFVARKRDLARWRQYLGGNARSQLSWVRFSSAANRETSISLRPVLFFPFHLFSLIIFPSRVCARCKVYLIDELKWLSCTMPLCKTLCLPSAVPFLWGPSAAEMWLATPTCLGRRPWIKFDASRPTSVEVGPLQFLGEG